MDNRKTFSQTLEEIHAPEALLNDTLKLMQAENDRLSATENQKTEETRQNNNVVAFRPARRITSALAVAACAALMVTGSSLLLSNSKSVEFSSVKLSHVPEVSFTVRGEAAEYTVEDFAAQYGLDFSSMGNGYALETADAEQGFNAQGQTLSLVSVCYMKDHSRLDIQAADFKTPIFIAMQELEPTQMSGVNVHLAIDEEARTLYAAWEKSGVFFVGYGSDWKQEDFAKQIEEMLKQ